MKRYSSLIAVAALWLLATSLAAARDMYGYVMGLGGMTNAIRSVRIIDNTTGFVHWADGYTGGYWGMGGIRWYKNNLPTGHTYTVVVESNGLGTRSTSHFYMAWLPWDYKAPDVNF